MTARVGRGRSVRRCGSLVLVAIAVVLAGCAGAPSGDAGSTEATVSEAPSTVQGPKEGHPALESQLYGLATADDPEAYAAAHGIELRNGSVRVLIELDSGATMPEGDDLSVVTRSGDRVVAWVPVGQLVPLADHDNVSFVRRPVEGSTY